ncbi:MAG: acyl-CoA/acyl-ACP dehydrogenase [Deltaproteobacteria bacterium]|nr:acyl-CoA/acyl-ACP dehydrogenase [Deltaproteobacteria bacterium]
MDFGLSEEQELLQETVRGFVANECPPPKLREIFDSGVGTDPSLWRGIVEMGLAGLVIPEVHGGAGMEFLEAALVAEVLGNGVLPGPYFGHTLASLALVLGGSDAQKKTWLPRLAAGEVIGTYAAAEENSQWEPSEWSVEEKNGELTGLKLYVPNANIADLIIVGCSRGRLALVERGAPGVTIEDMEGIDRSRPVFRLGLEAAPAEVLETGQDVSGRVRDAALLMLAADSFGVASRLIEMSVDYAKTREQFGSVIAQFQSVKHQLARLATDVEPTRALFWYGAHAFDHLPEEAERAAALAKAHITDRAMHTAREAVELHGGLGFTWECDVQMWYKRAMFNRSAFGTPDSLRGRIATLGGW